MEDAKNAEHSAVLSIAESCVRRLLEIGLPERQAFAARDAVLGHLENYGQRIRCGEWPKPEPESAASVLGWLTTTENYTVTWNPPTGMDV